MVLCNAARFSDNLGPIASGFAAIFIRRSNRIGHVVINHTMVRSRSTCQRVRRGSCCSGTTSPTCSRTSSSSDRTTVSGPQGRSRPGQGRGSLIGRCDAKARGRTHPRAGAPQASGSRRRGIYREGALRQSFDELRTGQACGVESDAVSLFDRQAFLGKRTTPRQGLRDGKMLRNRHWAKHDGDMQLEWLSQNWGASPPYGPMSRPVPAAGRPAMRMNPASRSVARRRCEAGRIARRTICARLTRGRRKGPFDKLRAGSFDDPSMNSGQGRLLERLW